MIPRRHARARGLSRTETGILIIILAMLCVSFIDALAKWTAASVAVGQIVWVRFAVQCLVLLVLLRLRRTALVGTFGRRHVIMGAMLAAFVLFLFWGLDHLPLANNTAIFFVHALVLTVISALFLGERIGPRRWVAVMVGLAGTLIVLRPNWSAYGAAAVLPFLAGTCYAVYLALTRTRAVREDVIVLQFWTGLVAALVLTAAMAAGWWMDIPVLAVSLPDAGSGLRLAAIGMLSAAVHVMIAAALKRARASVLAPFQYLEIVGAVTLGWAVFGDVPDAMTAAGGAVIGAAGLYVFLSERRLAQDAVGGAH